MAAHKGYRSMCSSKNVLSDHDMAYDQADFQVKPRFPDDSSKDKIPIFHRQSSFGIAKKQPEHNDNNKTVSIANPGSNVSSIYDHVTRRSISKSVELNKVIQTFMESDRVAVIKMLGFSSSLVQRAVENVVNNNGVGSLSLDNILEAIYELEEDCKTVIIVDGDTACGGSTPGIMNISTEGECTRYGTNVSKEETDFREGTVTLDSFDDFDKCQGEIGSIGSNCDKSTMRVNIEQQSRIQKLSQERDTLFRNNYCNKCLRNKIGILFLPCRHLVACADCGHQMSNCLKCNQNIAATVKIFV